MFLKGNSQAQTFVIHIHAGLFLFLERIGKTFVLVFSGFRYKCDGVSKRQERNIQLPAAARGKRATSLKVP